ERRIRPAARRGGARAGGDARLRPRGRRAGLRRASTERWRRHPRLTGRPPRRRRPRRRARRGARDGPRREDRQGGRPRGGRRGGAGGRGAGGRAGIAPGRDGHAAARGARGTRALHGGLAGDPDRDLLQDLHRHRPRRGAAPPQGRRPSRLLHPPDRLRDRACGERGDAGDGPPPREDRRAAPRGRRRARRARHRRRRRSSRRQPHAPGAGHPRRRPAVVHAVPGPLRRPRRPYARRRPECRRAARSQRHPDQSGRSGHRGVGAAADARTGDHRRDRSDRLPARPRAGRRAARRREGDDDHLHLRPPRHPGRRVGGLPRRGGGVPAGRPRLLRADLPRPRSGGLGGDRHRGGPRRSAGGDRHGRRGPPAGGPGGHLAAEGAPDARPPGGASRPAGIGAGGRSGARPGDGRPHARADAADTHPDPAHARRGPHAGRVAAAPPGHLLRHDRLRGREHRLAPPADLAAREDRVRRVPPPADPGRVPPAAAPADDGRLAGALPAPRVPRAEAVLHRGTRHDGPHARRADPPGGRQRRPRGGHRHGAPRTPQRPRAQPRALLRDHLPGVRGRLGDRGGHHPADRRDGRRQVPPWRDGQLRARRRPRGGRAPGIQSEPPRVHLAGHQRRHPRAADPPGVAPDPDRQPRRAAGDPARRCLLPRPGRGRRDAQPAGARRLHRRRDDPPHPEQPDRLHHRPRRRPLDALGVGSGQGLRRPDHPCQRRRRGRLHLRRAPRLRLSRRVRPRRPHRPDRLPALGPQRGRRAVLHAAADDGPHQGEAAGPRAVRRPDGRARGDDPGGRRRHRPPDLERDGGAPSPAQGGARRHQRGAADRRLPARPHALPRRRDRGARRRPARAQRGAAASSRGLRRRAQARQAGRAPWRDARGRGRDRLGPGRGAGLRVAAARGHPRAPHRPGRRARDLLPAPPGPARLQDRPALRADPGASGRHRADGAAQLAAVGDRLPGLRIRLRHRGARVARAVGGAVRRLRQRGAGDHRPVHRLGAGQVGTDEPAHAAAAARLRGLGARAFLRAPRALPAAVGGGQPARGVADHASAVLPPAAPPGQGR
ncbi:MAG: 2-oxoglutarate dehydrogenase E1 component, partial [uncultured Solirubrobacteraceae bacterium]